MIAEKSFFSEGTYRSYQIKLTDSFVCAGVNVVFVDISLISFIDNHEIYLKLRLLICIIFLISCRCLV